MKRMLLILVLQSIIAIVHSQSFTVDDLLKVSYLPSKDIDHFMSKKGYAFNTSKPGNAAMEANFSLRAKDKKKYIGPTRSIDICLKDDSKLFILHTSAANEYVDGQRTLIKSGFVYDVAKDINKDSSILFQKGNIAIQAAKKYDDSTFEYTFELKTKKLPHTIKYAEDLLQFDSHEFLVSFFGEKNVKKDMYYFSEKELKKCSVLFSGTKYQVFLFGEMKIILIIFYIFYTSCTSY